LVIELMKFVAFDWLYTAKQSNYSVFKVSNIPKGEKGKINYSKP